MPRSTITFPAEFEDLMASTVTVAARTTTDSYGKPTYATATGPFPARITSAPNPRRGNQTQNTAVSMTVYLPPAGYVARNGKTVVTVGVNDHVTVDGVARLVVGQRLSRDENGIALQTIDLE